MEIQAMGLTAELGKVESEISQAAQNLETAVSEENKASRENGAPGIPDPIKMIRRLTALEIALDHLKGDCENLSKRRAEVVHRVVTLQQETVSQVKEMLEKTEDADPYSSNDDIIDESWYAMTRSLEKQHRLILAGEETDA